MRILTVLLASACLGAAADVPYAVADRLTAPALRDCRVQGPIGAKFERFMYERCWGPYARDVVMREAEFAFTHPDDDVFNAPAGMWKGEFWGKLAISGARVAAYLGDDGYREFLRASARRILARQRPDGYLGTYLDPAFVSPGDIAKAQEVLGWPCDWCWNLWCRKYTAWGLLAVYDLTGDRAILDAAARAVTQQIEMLRGMNVKLCDTGTKAMVGMPSCSILKPLVLLYARTGKPLFLEYAREIVSYWDRPGNPAPNFFANAASGRPLHEWYPDRVGRWGKAYEMMSCLDGVLEYYRLTGEARCLEMVRAMQRLIARWEGNPVCSVGYNDQFTGAARHLNGTSEPCDAIHWIRLNLDLYLITGDAAYVNAIEPAFYNAFLAGVFRDGRWGAREVRSHGRHIARFGQSGMRFQHCCVDNMPRTFMDVAQLGAVRDGEAVRVNLYSPFTTDFRDGVSVTLSGDFPVADRVSAKVRSARSVRVAFRVPPWSAETRFRLPDGRVEAVAGGSRDFFETTLPAGDAVVRVTFDMTPRIVRSDAEASDVRTDYRYRRWASGGRDAPALFRTTPAARLFRGPLLLAKSKNVGDGEEAILRTGLNAGGWRVALKPFDDDRVMGAWTATFTKGGESFSVDVCDFPSAGDELLPAGDCHFSIFF